MPRLDWIGRKAVENHHWQVPFHLIKEVSELLIGDPGSPDVSRFEAKINQSVCALYGLTPEEIEIVEGKR